MCDVGKWEYATKIKVAHLVPLLNLVANRVDPTRLGYKVNHEVGQEHNSTDQAHSFR